jgi:exosome complex RNA-binding protein Csl4
MTKDKPICSECGEHLTYIIDDDYIELYCKNCDEIRERRVKDE